MKLANSHLKTLLLFIALLLWSLNLKSQVILGSIYNEFGEPVPYANVFVQQQQTGTLSDDEGNYVLRMDVEGEYRLVFSSLGYESQSREVLLQRDTMIVNVRLQTSGVELAEITVNADKRDPAFGIIKKVIEHKQRHLEALGSYRSRVYLKAVEKIESKETKSGKEQVTVATGGEPEDPFAAEQAAQRALLGGLNMVEMELTLNYQYPNRYKEERTAYQSYGDKDGLFVPRFAETDFNFYRNLVRLGGISDAPVISPLSNTAILSYKYELLSTDYEAGQLVYKIKVIPRKSGNSTVSGLLYINEGHWTINRLALDLPKGALVFSDDFTLEQGYSQVSDSLWMIDRQVFTYETTANKGKRFSGSTTLRYDEIEPNFDFPAKFFGNEVAVTTQEAYERDGTYWANSRTEALQTDEAEMVQVRDSIYAVVNSKPYKDSIQALYNKVTLLDLAWDGVGVRNHEKKTHFYVGPLASLIDFNPVGGWRVGPYVSTFKRYPSGRILSNSGSVNIGLKNKDVQGDFSSWFRYDPFRLGDVSVSGGRSFESINQYDAYLNLLKPSNYILKDAIRLGQRIELFNGLFFGTSFELSGRKPLTGYDVSTFVDGIVEDEEEVLDFEAYEALITTSRLSYTPGQKYLREPNRKIIIGSKWPTFSIAHTKGWNGGLGSDIDFDYLQFSVEQDIVIGTLGNSKYRAQIGQFVNTKDLRFVDFKRFRESDPILYSDPLNSFQSLDTSLNTTNIHFEFHHIHHFNGALINNIPLLKKTRLKVVAGGGFLWLRDGDFRHQEVFAGLERVFKIGARRRLRVGVFGVAADSSNGRPDTSFKISFDLIDTWKRDWSF